MECFGIQTFPFSRTCLKGLTSQYDTCLTSSGDWVDVHLPKELAFQERAPAENPNHGPCARAVLETVAYIVAHIVLDRYRCTGVQTSACGIPGQLVCELPQRCLSAFLNVHISVDSKRRVRSDCSTNFAHTTEESPALDWRIFVSSGAIFCRH
jgi:hypothetical protein